MSLISCYECGRQISDKAAFCPGCGAPNEKINKQNIAPFPTPPTQSSNEPKEVTYHKDKDLFYGTKYLMIKLAMRAIQEFGWKIDQTNDNLGLVTFQTAMSWGSFSGVSCSLNIDEVEPCFFKVIGSGKQNSSGHIALDFGEAQGKAQKAIDRMKELAYNKNSSNVNPSKYADIDIAKPAWEFGDYKIKVEELHNLINKELKRIFGGGMTDEIFEKLTNLCKSRENALYLLKTYQEIYKLDLIDNIKKLNLSFAAIKRNLSMFIDHGIIEKEFPHNPVRQ